MITVFMLPAGQGDFFILKYGADGDEHYIFIDGGDRAGAVMYKAALKCLLDKKKTIDALIFTHIDDDHIYGALAAMSSMEKLPEIQKIYINTGRGIEKQFGLKFEQGYPEDEEKEFLHKKSTEHSVSKALNLLEFLAEKGLDGRIQPCVHAGKPLEIGPAVLHVISPGSRRLTAYAQYWYSELERMKEKKQSTHAARKDGNKQVLSSYVNEKVQEDDSIINGSSIAFLFEYDGVCLAFLGDAWPSECVSGVKELHAEGISVELVKIPHHGSVRNFSKEMCGMLKSRCFLLSTNGRRGHPSPAFLGKLFHTIPDARIYCNCDWMKEYGFAAEDWKDYCTGDSPKICVVKKAVNITDRLMLCADLSQL